MEVFEIKLSGSAATPTDLDKNKNHVISAEVEEVSRTTTDLKNGDEMVSIKVKPVRIMMLNEAGEKIRLKTKNANSVRIRAAVYNEQKKRKPEVAETDRDLFYDLFADRLISNLSGVLDLLGL